MTAYKVSILLAVYNGEKHIQEAIDSILSQTYNNWELIIVSNGSTDNTAQICEAAVAKDDRIIFYSFEQKGKTKAYNKAFELSSGQYLFFFAADDKLTPNNIFRRIEVLNGEENVFATCLCKTFSENPVHDGVIFPKNIHIPNYSGGCMFYPTTLAQKAFPIPENLPNEDTWISLHLRAFGKNIHLPEVLIDYRIHDNNSYGYSLSFEEKREKFLHRMSAYGLFYEKYRGQGVKFVDEYVGNFVKSLSHAKKFNRFKLLTAIDLPLRERLIFVFYSSPFLYKLRYKYFKFFSGIFN